jgi:hypothetical protein
VQQWLTIMDVKAKYDNMMAELEQKRAKREAGGS